MSAKSAIGEEETQTAVRSAGVARVFNFVVGRSSGDEDSQRGSDNDSEFGEHL